jgi:DNA-binding HxlR family transcriptional regulator
MPVQRGYRQACGVARGMDLVGERWALLIVRELLLGPKRFTDLRAGMPGASPNALTDRLRELTAAGVLRRRQLPAPAASWVYELTDWGRELEPIVVALGTWALGTPPLAEQTFVGVDSVMLTVRTYYTGRADRTDRADRSTNLTGGAPGHPAGAVEPVDPEAGGPVDLVVRLTEGGIEHAFGVRLHDGAADVRHELPPQPDATVRADSTAFLTLLGDPDRLPAALAAGMTIDGDPAAVDRLIAGITVPGPRPPKART